MRSCAPEVLCPREVPARALSVRQALGLREALGPQNALGPQGCTGPQECTWTSGTHLDLRSALDLMDARRPPGFCLYSMRMLLRVVATCVVAMFLSFVSGCTAHSVQPTPVIEEPAVQPPPPPPTATRRLRHHPAAAAAGDAHPRVRRQHDRRDRDARELGAARARSRPAWRARTRRSCRRSSPRATRRRRFR